jgi:DNA gyrase subunit A
MPRVLGVREILEEWTAWRTECVRRRIYFQKQKKADRLHLLKGLERILLDIDKAVAIIRGTELESEVVPNLMIGFGIDEIQANFVAEIKLRNLNREYILKRVAEVDTLTDEIADLKDIINSPKRIHKIMTGELQDVKKKYDTPRRTEIIYEFQQAEIEKAAAEEVPDYPVNVFISKEGYFKKITPLSLRMSGEQKYKEGDSAFLHWEGTNRDELLVFTDKFQCYKTRLSDFEDSKASLLGDYLPGKLGFEEGESALEVCFPGDYSGNMLFLYENGKVAKVELSAYQTKSNRRKLTGAYSDKSPLKAAFLLKEDTQIVLYSTENRALIFSTAQLAPKTTRTTQGVAVLTLKKKHLLYRAALLENCGIVNQARYRTKSLPAAGALLKPEDGDEKQLEMEL